MTTSTRDTQIGVSYMLRATAAATISAKVGKVTYTLARHTGDESALFFISPATQVTIEHEGDFVLTYCFKGAFASASGEGAKRNASLQRVELTDNSHLLLEGSMYYVLPPSAALKLTGWVNPQTDRVCTCELELNPGARVDWSALASVCIDGGTLPVEIAQGSAEVYAIRWTGQNTLINHAYSVKLTSN